VARYISQEILCEAYTRLNTNLYNTDEARARLRDQLLPFFEERARFLLGDEVQVEIVFETGSLITKLRVVGSAGLIVLPLLTGYAPFKESVSQLTRDVTLLAESANLEVLFRTNTPYCDRINIEKRKGVFGRVDDLLSRLDKIGREISSDVLPNSTRAVEEVEAKVDAIVDWNGKVGELFSKLDSAETKVCVSQGLLDELAKFPASFGWTQLLLSAGIRGSSVRSDASLLGKLSGSNTRLKVTLTSIQKDLKQRMDLAKKEMSGVS